MLFDDIVDGDRRPYLHTFGMRVLRKQSLRVAFNGLFGYVRDSEDHFGQSSSASSNTRTLLLERYFSFALCACRARLAISSAVNPFAARRKSAISRGRRRMISVRSDATRPASASNSSGSRPMISAIFFTLSSAGGSKSPRSILDR